MPYVVMQTMPDETCLMRAVEWVRLKEGIPQWVEVEHDDKGRCRAYARTVHVEMAGEWKWDWVPNDPKDPSSQTLAQVPHNFLCLMNDVLVTDSAEEALRQFKMTFNGSEMRLVEEDDETKFPPPPPQMAKLEFIPCLQSGAVYLIR